MANTRIELLQFPYSHFNEKARWALDFKGVEHTRRSLLPGPHAMTVKRLTGQVMVPVVRFGDEIVYGSARIIDELEHRYPEPPLYPADAAARKRALEIQTWFDDELGPLVRRGIFSVFMRYPGYTCGTFSEEYSAPVRAVYRATFPIARSMMKKGMGISDQASIDEGYAGTEKALDFVAKEGGRDGYLVGDTFTVADLAAAALLAPTSNPPDSTMQLPEPRPQGVVEWHKHWAKHPGVAWVLGQYRRNRHRAGTTSAAA